MKKFIGIVVVLALVAVLAGLFMKDRLIKGAVEDTIRELTGLELTMESMTVSLWNTTVRVQGARLMNPPGFPEPVAVEVEDLFVDFDLLSLFSDEIHLKVARIIIPQLTLIRNKDGVMNVSKMTEQAGKEASAGGTPGDAVPEEVVLPEESAPGEDGEEAVAKTEKRMRVDELIVKLDQVAYFDYSMGGPEPSVFRHNMGVDIHEFDVTSIDQIVGRVTGQLFMGGLGNMSAIADLGGREVERFVENNEEEIQKIEKMAEDKLAEVGDVLQRLADDPESPVHDLLGALMGGGAKNAEGEAEGEADTVGQLLESLKAAESK